MQRELDLVVISDCHLGTYGCQASELLLYLKSIKPKTLIINGDFIDIWQFKKSYFPKSHLKIIKRVIDFSMNGTKVIYITGNHDEFLRRLTPLKFGKIEIVDKKLLKLDGKLAWFFHGDIFDGSLNRAKWLSKLGGKGYDLLIQINTFTNWVLNKMGKEKYSFSKKIKQNIKKAVKHINDFEQTAVSLAIEKNYDYVICGHIHQPQNRMIVQKNGSCRYLNSGDWVESLTSLEYSNKEWDLYHFSHKDYAKYKNEQEMTDIEMKSLEYLINEITSK
jgi:UDP-2,3-diacylglucosamine pyrophosphatase LpxH